MIESNEKIDVDTKLFGLMFYLNVKFWLYASHNSLHLFINILIFYDIMLHSIFNKLIKSSSLSI